MGLVASGKPQTQPMCIKFTHVRAHIHNSGLLSLCLSEWIFFPNALARSPPTVNLKDDYLVKKFSTRGILPHKGQLAIHEDIFGYHNLGRGCS